jgi:trigger factor
MKFTRFVALACAILTLSVSAVSCSGSWKGFENTDVSKYVKVGQYKGVSVLLNTPEITDDDIQQRINQALAASKYEQEITGRPVEAGDFVRFDYTATVDGAADPNFKGTDTAVQIGANAFHAQLGDIESAFIGHSTGDTFTVNGTFPENYSNVQIENSEAYSGKSIVFEITLKKIYDLVLPELTDEFVQSISSTSTTVEQYKEEIRAQLAEEVMQTSEQQKLYGSWAAVMETVEVIEYPKAALDDAVKEIENSYNKLANSTAMSLETYVTQQLKMTMEQFNEQVQTYAKNTVKEQLVLYYIAQKENLSVTDEEYESAIADYCAKYNYESPEEFEEFYGSELIRQSMLWDKVIKLIIENATYSEVSELETETAAG